jgi:hypothetical protein
MDWEKGAIEAAADYLRELIDAGAADERTRSVYNGLVDVIDPTRYATRIQRALAADAALALVRAGLDRRNPVPRRRRAERRLVNADSLNGERRSAGARRIALDRRGC